MDKQKRTPIIAGNWKMNLTRPKAGELIKELRPLVANSTCQIVLCVPFTDLDVAAKALKGSNIKLGAQNCHWAENGAFTGEVSAQMLKECGCEYVILGHSERRQYFGETNQTLNMRLKAALKEELLPIVCVGETLEQRDGKETTEVIFKQLTEGLAEIDAKDMKKIVVAYEPVWAIGTGKTATAEQAGEVCAFIRGVIAGMYNEELSYEVQIQYGGSMNPKNAQELLGQYDIDGGLIGGASLKAEDFSKIIACAQN